MRSFFKKSDAKVLYISESTNYFRKKIKNKYLLLDYFSFKSIKKRVVISLQPLVVDRRKKLKPNIVTIFYPFYS